MVCTIETDGSIDPAWAALQEVSIVQFLCQDKRPSFVIDLQIEPSRAFVPLVNQALHGNQILFDLVTGHDSNQISTDESDRQLFLNWTQESNSNSAAQTFQHADFTWSHITLASRWKVFVADLNSSLCACTVSEFRPSLTTKTSSTQSSDIHQPLDTTETRPVRRPSRPDTQTTSTTDGSLYSAVRARNFFAETSQEPDTDSLTETAKTAPVLNDNPIEGTNLPETSVRSAWSDIQNAKRNADLLTKISAFDFLGIFITNIDGELVFANNAWYKICGIPHGPANAESWLGIFEDSEVPKIAEVWRRVTVEQGVQELQCPLKWRWNPPTPSDTKFDSEDFPVWISVWAYADVSSDGETVGCCCVLADISQQKWAERLMEQQLSEAVERTSVLEQLSLDMVALETRFRRLSDAMPHGIFICDMAGKMLYTNEAFREIFPASTDPKTLEPWWMNVPEDELPRAVEIWRKVREDRVKVSFEMPFLRVTTQSDGSKTPGERRYMATSAYPELDENGEIKHFIGCITDISHLRMAERIQGARADIAEESKHQLEQFIDMTSHEIRNPLSAILHSAEEVLACVRDFPESMTVATVTNVIDTVETIIDCTNHSTRIVEDILVVSKLNSGLLSITPTVVQLVPAVEKVLRMFGGEMRAADISHSLTIDKSFDRLDIDWIYLDISRVLQILINLITNAIKFTRPENVRSIQTLLSASKEKPTSMPDRDEPRYLAVQTTPSGSYLNSLTTEDEVVYINFAVIDTGCGLSDAEQKNLFQRFSQAGTRTHIKYGGTGLGLFISRQLSEMQGGQIGLRSTPGKGSVFTFYIKALKSNIPAIRDVKAGTAATRFGNHHAQVTKPQVNKSTMSTEQIGAPLACQRTVLLVEDNLVNQKVVAKMLKANGFTVMVANHGQEAIKHIRGSALLAGALTNVPPISIVLLDVEMPVMDGLTCIRHIRKMENSGELRCHVPVVATTAYARQEQIDQAKEAGMDDIVTKPFRMDQLLDVMTQLWERYPT